VDLCVCVDKHLASLKRQQQGQRDPHQCWPTAWAQNEEIDGERDAGSSSRPFYSATAITITITPDSPG